MRPPSAEELTRKWEKAPWSRSLHDPSKPYEYDSLDLRLCRAISWLERAEVEKSRADADAEFIFHWIAFNAMYGQLENSSTDKGEAYYWSNYFHRIDRIVVFADSKSVIYDTVWSVCQGEIEAILNNRFVFEPFWTHHNNQAKCRKWEQRFVDARDKAKQAFDNRQTETVLCKLFDRLYTLRNQLLHGGAKWKSTVNRNQVEKGAKIMSLLVPYFIDVMIEHPKGWGGWGAPRYPVVPVPEKDLPYDMGNAGDLLKHGALATFVDWFLGRPGEKRIRYADPFGGRPWGELKDETRKRLHKLSSALPVIQSAQPHWQNRNRYYGSSHVVRNVAKSRAEVLASDKDELARSALEASRIDLIEKVIETYDPGDGFGILSKQYDGRFDLILLDPFGEFLRDEFSRNRTQTGHFTSISRAVKRNSDLCIMLFVLDMTENYIHDIYLEEKEKLKDFSFSLRCPKLKKTGVRGETKYNTEILLISKRFAEGTTSIEELKDRLRNLGRTLETVLPEPGNRIEFWPSD